MWAWLTGHNLCLCRNAITPTYSFFFFLIYSPSDFYSCLLLEEIATEQVLKLSTVCLIGTCGTYEEERKRIADGSLQSRDFLRTWYRYMTSLCTNTHTLTSRKWSMLCFFFLCTWHLSKLSLSHRANQDLLMWQLMQEVFLVKVTSIDVVLSTAPCFWGRHSRSFGPHVSGLFIYYSELH